MAFKVSRTDTGQFVLMDPSTDAVIIDDDLARGFDKLEQTVADNPGSRAEVDGGEITSGAGPTTQGSSAFAFRGGPRYTPVLLAVVLPFAWLAVLYFALANLLSEQALDRGASKETQTRLEQLEREVQSLRTELAGAPRAAKSKAKKRKKSKPSATKVDEAAKGETAEGVKIPETKGEPTKANE